MLPYRAFERRLCEKRRCDNKIKLLCEESHKIKFDLFRLKLFP